MNKEKSICLYKILIWHKRSLDSKNTHLLTPCPEHSKLLWLLGHFPWSICGKMLVH